ncbi:MAG TPA: hypothetical protein VFJ16_05110 [Longimicrobium sp.]|nr:hypothetical protein [Longimicrobium sp.]
MSDDLVQQELKAQQVGPAVRTLCGTVALALVAAGMALAARASEMAPVAILLFALIAAPFGWLAAFGVKVAVIDPVASERFLELADPSRPLPETAPITHDPVPARREG